MQQKFEKIRDLLVREKWDELTADERQMLEERTDRLALAKCA